MLLSNRLILVGLFVIFLAQPTMARDIIYSDYNIVRNGDFENDDRAWHDLWCSISSSAARDGDGGMLLGSLSDDDRYTFQQIPVPTELHSARLRFDCRSVEELGGAPVNPGLLEVSIGTTRGFDSHNLGEVSPLNTIGVIHTERFDSVTDWQEYSMELDPSLVNAMQTARDAGEFIFLEFSHLRPRESMDHRGHDYIIHIDNLSLTVNGIQKVPAMQGKIAYVEEDEENDPHAINILDPNTNRVETIWTHPGKTVFPWRDVIWSPDATELAFVSDHEFISSPFKADIYAVKPDGSGIRKVTGAPSQEEISRGNYPRVTVTGRLLNNVDDWDAARNHIIMGIQYHKGGTSLVVNDSEIVPFTIPDVPVLDDPAIFNQTVIIHFSNDTCTAGLEYHFPTALVENGTVDLGTIPFFGLNCLQRLGTYVPRGLTWKRDGSEIAFDMLGFKKVSSGSSRSFDWTEIEPDGSIFSSNMQWSPVDDRYLFRDWSLSGYGDIYIAEEGGEPQLLVDNYVKHGPAWLPDASGFVYIRQPSGRTSFDDNIFFYDMESGESQRLTYFGSELVENLSVAPDGQHIIFERHDDITDASKDFWIMDRLNPANMWRVTHTGNCSSPDWSRREVSMVSGSNLSLLMIPVLHNGRPNLNQRGKE